MNNTLKDQDIFDKHTPYNPFAEPKYSIVSFEDFCAKFEAAWYPLNRPQEARNKLEVLMQGSSNISEYSAVFRLLVTKAGYSWTDLIQCFCKGLNQSIRDVLGDWDQPMETLIKLHNTALKVELQKAEFSARHNAPAITTPPTLNTNNWQSRNSFNRALKPTASSNSSTPQLSPGITLMEVNTGELICYHCYVKGHITQKCSNNKKTFRKVVYKEAGKKIATTTSPKFEPAGNNQNTQCFLHCQFRVKVAGPGSKVL